MLSTSDFDYVLPPELIAQYPADRRGDSRMLVLDRKSGESEIMPFREIVHYFSGGDALICNNTKVLRGRMFARKNGEEAGAKFEILLIERLSDGSWLTMMRPGKRAVPGIRALFLERGTGRVNGLGDGFEVLSKNADGTVILRFFGAEIDILQIRYGHIPLPPYIGREDEASDADRYQTVYAREPGAVAAPTAGLHFTEDILRQMRERGVSEAELTLHVGPGTFKPVATENISEHKMHSESFILPEATAQLVNRIHQGGGKVLAVGTTTVRVLESCVDENGIVHANSGRTEIFLYPPCQLRAVDALLTNFHLPKSTLIMLVSCLCEREKVLAAYRKAVENKMHFYSYGDCMLLI